MRGTTKRSLFWPNLFTGFFLLLFLSLGTWQLYRLSWKEKLLSNVSERVVQQNLTMSDIHDVTPETLEGLEFRKLRVTGKFFHEHQYFLQARPRGGSAGVHIITPFQTEQGPLLLVNRGWVSQLEKGSLDQPLEPLTLEGIIRLEAPSSFFTPENDYKKGEIYRIAPLKIGKETPLPLLPFYLQQTEPASREPPYVLTSLPEIKNPHLGYAITWFSLALTVLALYIVFRKKHFQK